MQPPIASSPLPEPYDVWDEHYQGFSRPCRDLEAWDVPNSLPKKIRAAFAKQQVAMNKPCFLTKYTGWSRIRFIDTIFPDALYLNIIRDGRATKRESQPAI